MKTVAQYIERLDPNTGDRMIGYFALFGLGFLFALHVLGV